MTGAHLSDEAHDASPIGVEDCMDWLAYAVLALVLLVAFLLGTMTGSWLLHTFDTEIREGLAWAWLSLEHLLWTWAALYW